MAVNDVPCTERTFPLKLRVEYPRYFCTYTAFLRYMLERFGRETVLKVWDQAFHEYDEEFLVKILSSGWMTEGKDLVQFDQVEESVLRKQFPYSVDGVTAEHALNLIGDSPPFYHIKQYQPTLTGIRETTAYEALHLFKDALALLVEVIILIYGKEGEFVVYDGLRFAIETCIVREELSIQEYFSRTIAEIEGQIEERDIVSAGLDRELLYATEKEVVSQVTACEWARYYHDHHPDVGQLMECSHDYAAFRAINERIRMQRTSTIMGGGEVCAVKRFYMNVAEG